ncbi:MAG: serine--tRNA ligase [Patescibacteria group bacterium]|nr:serine--tRNA ligase [Patescibacteria group bacterium]
MIDLKDLIARPDFYKISSHHKGYNLDKEIEILIEKKQILNRILKERDNLRFKLNIFSKNKPNEKNISEIKEIKRKIKLIEKDIKEIEKKINNLLKKIPNPPLVDVPLGTSEKDNVIIRLVGEKKDKALDYLDLSLKLDLIDIKRASKISGTRFAYLKNKLVFLELAIIQFVLEKLVDFNFLDKVINKNNLKVKNNVFIPILPPVLIKKEIMENLGYLDSGEIDFFEIKENNFFLVGTAEHSIVPYFKDEILEKKQLPLRFIAFSSCFRKEAGSYGKDTKGILRVHQFDKLEMVSFTVPEESLEELKFLLSIEEYLMQLLKIPYRVMERCTADLGHPTAKGYDIEAWLPSEKNYRETHSCSTTTDYQARRLNIRFKDKEKLRFVHILNATAFALGRIMIAILENHQEGNKIKIPEALIPYTKFKEII